MKTFLLVAVIGLVWSCYVEEREGSKVKLALKSGTGANEVTSCSKIMEAVELDDEGKASGLGGRWAEAGVAPMRTPGDVLFRVRGNTAAVQVHKNATGMFGPPACLRCVKTADGEYAIGVGEDSSTFFDLTGDTYVGVGTITQGGRFAAIEVASKTLGKGQLGQLTIADKEVFYITADCRAVNGDDKKAIEDAFNKRFADDIENERKADLAAIKRYEAQ